MGGLLLMLTYSPHSGSLPKPTEKPWVLLLLCFIWLWPGILGHDPWKPEEPYVMAVIDAMLRTGNWVLPAIQGVPYLDSPPLYYWVAAGFVKVLSPWLLTSYDAARLATPLFMSVTMLMAGMSGRDLIGRRYGRSVIMVLIGCIGLIVNGHAMIPLVATMAGLAAAFYALSLTLRSPGLAGALLGAATVEVFLTSSLLEVALIWVVVVMLPAFSAWRGKHFAITVAMALLVSVPVSVIWPLELYKTYPSAFHDWWTLHALGPLNGFGHVGMFHEFGYYTYNTLWFAWPAWPLAAWTLYRTRRYDEPVIQLPLMFAGVVLILLTMSDRQSMDYALPMLLPLSVLAAIELDNLRRGAAAFLNWFGVMAFGLFGLLIWAGWLAMNFGWPEKLAERARFFSPFYHPQVSVLAAIFALLATIAWVWAVTRRHLRGRQAVTNWAAGMILLWGLGLTLWLPWLDATKSYRPVVDSMMQAMPKGERCVATYDDNLIAIVSWRSFVGQSLIPFDRDEPVPCDYWLLAQTPDPGQVPAGWEVIWTGGRPREKVEIFALLRRKPVGQSK